MDFSCLSSFLTIPEMAVKNHLLLQAVDFKPSPHGQLGTKDFCIVKPSRAHGFGRWIPFSRCFIWSAFNQLHMVINTYKVSFRHNSQVYSICSYLYFCPFQLNGGYLSSLEKRSFNLICAHSLFIYILPGVCCLMCFFNFTSYLRNLEAIGFSNPTITGLNFCLYWSALFWAHLFFISFQIHPVVFVLISTHNINVLLSNLFP